MKKQGWIWALAAFFAVALGQGFPKLHLNVVGTWGHLTMFKAYEKPFWEKTIPEKTGGQITTEVRPFNEMGLKGAEIFRLLGKGLFDVGSTVLDYVASDATEVEGLDLAGLAMDIQTARKEAEAYKPFLDEVVQKKFGIKALAVYPYPAQVLFCNAPITSLADLKGKKVRTSGRSLAEFVEALGATGVTMPFSEVPQALQRKVVDCAITGTSSGYNAKWYEVVTHVYPLPLGWDPVMAAMNLKRWNSLDEKTQAFLLKEAAGLEDAIWKASERETQEGLNCLTGQGDCSLGQPANLTLVPVSESDRALVQRILVETVVPKWAARCGPDCAERWNETIGRVVGIEAPVK